MYHFTLQYLINKSCSSTFFWIRNGLKTGEYVSKGRMFSLYRLCVLHCSDIILEEKFMLLVHIQVVWAGRSGKAICWIFWWMTLHRQHFSPGIWKKYSKRNDSLDNVKIFNLKCQLHYMYLNIKLKPSEHSTNCVWPFSVCNLSFLVLKPDGWDCSKLKSLLLFTNFPNWGPLQVNSIYFVHFPTFV